jgi:hypothetical protein
MTEILAVSITIFSILLGNCGSVIQEVRSINYNVRHLIQSKYLSIDLIRKQLVFRNRSNQLVLLSF